MEAGQAIVNRPVASVGIAICTYRRPELLRALLESIARQELRGRDVDIELAIVDNSPDLEGRAVVDDVASSYRFPIAVDHEPIPGIATTRNRSVSLLRGRDAIIFIDDDETADPDWLDQLIGTAERYDADVVSGPVFPRFESPPPDWATAGRFYERPRFPTGSVTGATATSNLLVRWPVFDTLGEPWFEPKLGTIGCDDTHFLERAQRSGHPLVWCDEAGVHETFPPSRVTVRWLVQRQFRGGNSHVIVQRMVAPGWRTHTRIVTKAGVRLVISLAAFPVAVWRPTWRVWALRSLASGVGQFAGYANVRYEEYAHRPSPGIGARRR